MTDVNPGIIKSTDDIATEAKQDEIIAGVEAATDTEGLGDITVGTDQVEISITGTPTKYIRIKADDDNTGIIYLGKTGVANDGSNDVLRLKSGDETIIPYDDALNSIYVISDTTAQTINVGVLL